MKNQEYIVKVYSEKENGFVEIDLYDQSLPEESYQCVGCSNSDYGS